MARKKCVCVCVLTSTHQLPKHKKEQVREKCWCYRKHVILEHVPMAFFNLTFPSNLVPVGFLLLFSLNKVIEKVLDLNFVTK